MSIPPPELATFVTAVAAQPGFDAESELQALVRQHSDPLELLDVVIATKLAPKEIACRLWADAIGVAYVDPFASVITDEAIEAIPAEIAQKVGIIGLYVINGVLTAALASPTDAERVKRVSLIAQMPISPVFALRREVADAIQIHYSSEKKVEDSLHDLERNELISGGEFSAEAMSRLADSDVLIKILDEIIYFALRERATDLHVEPRDRQCRIRFRIDGMLREMLVYSRKIHRALISRLKIMANLDISESRFPQDGRFSMLIGSTESNFRLSTLPTQYGEKAVVRILASGGKNTMITLDKMMMSQTVLQPFRQLIRNPTGLLFVTGPTGSGKTTTLYAALQEINQPDINISTIEDPIEIKLEGVTQTQVNSTIDLKFATILRSLLRQDPDALLVGEIRDLETAKIATEAALTGHIVFATLHTNSATQAITRLIEIGVEPYMVAPSVIGVLAQRLAARICEGCKEPYYPSRKVLQRFFADEGLEDVPFYRGRGCPKCRGTGYKGRVGFHELVVITEEIRTLISSGASAQEISAAASKVGYRPLRYDGLKKALLGLTTIEEIEAQTSVEWVT